MFFILLGMVYLFGLTKKTGEANMYPKPIRDLQGWKVRSVGCSYTSIVVAADESVIAFGPSPTYGELVIILFTIIYFYNVLTHFSVFSTLLKSFDFL